MSKNNREKSILLLSTIHHVHLTPKTNLAPCSLSFFFLLCIQVEFEAQILHSDSTHKLLCCYLRNARMTRLALWSTSGILIDVIGF
jgi:hypothetical protein